MRQVSIEGIRSLFAQETAHVWVPALTFTPPSSAVINIVANTQDVIYPPLTGDVYLAMPFELSLAPDTEDTVPQARIRVDNVDQSIVALLRTITEPLPVTLRVFRIEPDLTVFQELSSQFHLLSVTIDSLIVEGTLGYNIDFLNEPAVRDSFTPSVAPGLFS